MATQQMAVQEQSFDPAGGDWPELIVSRAHVRREDNHFVAILERFSIIGMGDTPGAAWQNMDELATAYLELCEMEGMPFAEVIRPLPVWQQLRLRIGTNLEWPLVLLARALRQRRESPRTKFVRAHPDPQHAIC
jgi:hypothetical protein